MRRRAVATVGAAMIVATLVSGCGAGGRPEAVRPAVPASAPPDSRGAASAPSAPPSAPAPPPSTAVPTLRPAPAPPPERPVRATGPLAPVVYRIPTSDRVVFLGIDDGATKDPAFLALIRATRIPFTAFLTDSQVRTDYRYFAELQRSGVGIGNHTLTHPQLNRLPYAAQKREICGAADRYRDVFGTRPVILRPPYGSYNQDTRRATTACGMRALVNWNVSLPGRKLRFATGDRLRPGDIILTHFRPTLLRDFVPMLRRIEREGFAIARLEDYV